MKKQLLYLLIVCTPFFGYSQDWEQIGQNLGQESSAMGYSTVLNNDGSIMAVSGLVNTVRVYELVEDEWVQKGSDIIEEGSMERNVVRLNGAGNILALSRSTEVPEEGDAAGLVRVFEYDGTDWMQMGSTLEGSLATSNFGYSLSLDESGSILAVGSYGDTDIIGTGQAQVFEFDGNNWVQLGQSIPGEFENDRFGASICLSADGLILAAGGPGHEGGIGNSSGHVRTFQYVNGEWEQQGSSLLADAPNDGFGFYLSFNNSGSRLAVGAWPAAGIAGYVKTFEFNDGDWSQLGSKILGTTLSATGRSISLNGEGTTMAIGAPGIAPAFGNVVKIYNFEEDDWFQVGSDILPETGISQFGFSVCLSDFGNTCSIGGYQNNNGGTISGYTGVFKYECEQETPVVSGLDPICAQSSTTISATVTSGTIQWYESLASTEPIFIGTEFETPELTESTSYFIESTEGLCISGRVEVEVSVTPTPEAPVVSETDAICIGESVILSASSSGTVSWFETLDATEAIFTGADFEIVDLQETTSYFVEASESNCVSDREEVMVSVLPNPEAPTGDSEQYFFEGANLETLEIDAVGDVTWYSDAELTEEIDATTELSEGVTYYVTQTVDGCEGAALAITVFIDTSSIRDNVIEGFSYYPNPVSSVLNLKSEKESIVSIHISDVSGKNVNTVQVNNLYNIQIPLEGLTNGIYLLSVTTSESVGVFRVIKK